MKGRGKSLARFIGALLLMGAAALLIHSHSRAEVYVPREPLEDFPMQVGNWSGVEVPISSMSRAVLGPGDFLERNYTAPTTQSPLDLFIAYFPSQRTGDTIHSPKNCLPGAGWTPTESAVIQIPWQNGRVTANRYVLQQGLDRQVVIYWYQAHGRTEASEYWAKYYLVSDAVRLNRTDGALVRVITLLGDQESVASGQQRALGFIHLILPLLNAYIPS